MQVIDVSKLNQDGRCVFGTTITLMNLTDDSEIIYQIVGEDEADISLGDLTFESAAYVARYVVKKINGQQKFLHYAVINHETGEFHDGFYRHIRRNERSEFSAAESFCANAS
jgi:hypothetical protein